MKTRSARFTIIVWFIISVVTSFVATRSAWATNPVDRFYTALDRAQGDVSKIEDYDSIDDPLTAEQASQIAARGWERWSSSQQEKMLERIKAKSFEWDGKELKWLERRFGNKPANGYSLFISMHGGGGAPQEVNDQQWRNQIRLYEPAEGIVVAPRAPTDTWDLWHQSHIDGLFEELIETYSIAEGIDRNRVYLLGYSAGGDGVYQLAPRMADRFAAASMMAGHPNEARPFGLRDLPFAIFMGGKDSAYRRNEVAAEWAAKLDQLQKEDPKGYVHDVHIFADKSHWMGGEDRIALAWMQKFTRKPFPTKIVWFQDDVVHDSFYWLSVDKKSAAAGQKITAEIEGNQVSIAGDNPGELRCWFAESMIDFEKPVEITWNGQVVFNERIPRTARSIIDSLRLNQDPTRTAVAVQSVRITGDSTK